jgi:hypothetical protein
MNPALWLHPTLTGLALAAFAVIAGAWLFSNGLRALRLRHGLRDLAAPPAGTEPNGFTHLNGRVTLESPLFAPLSAAPCAGFRLEARAVGLPLLWTVEERRAFRITVNGVAAHVQEDGATWELEATAQREIAAADPLSEALAALLARAPEALWWRRSGGTLQLTERALRSGAECHVVGSVRGARRHELVIEEEVELARTGTDGAAEFLATRPSPVAPGLWVGPGDHLDFLLVSDRAPDTAQHMIPAYKALGVFAGPAISLAGMLYLAAAADVLRSLGRF